jgi:hypothetical protein
MKRFLLCLALAAFMSGAAWADGGFIPRYDARDITEPNQKALIVCTGNVEDLILQVRYAGATEDFAWIVPTPSRPRIGRCSETLFYDLAEFTSPYTGRGGGFGGGFGQGGGYGAGGVEVLDRQQVGMYDVTVLDANDPRALVDWLNRNGYAVSSRITRVLDDYIRRGWYFTAARINLKPTGETGEEAMKKRLEQGTIQPLRLTFMTAALVYPLKISSLNGGQTDLLLYVMADVPFTAAGFQTTFKRRVDATELNRLTKDLPAISHTMWLTKLHRKMLTANMTQDVLFTFRTDR